MHDNNNGEGKSLSNEDIVFITGHKDAVSIDCYDRPSDSRKHRLVKTLALSNSSIEHREQHKQTEKCRLE